MLVVTLETELESSSKFDVVTTLSCLVLTYLRGPTIEIGASELVLVRTIDLQGDQTAMKRSGWKGFGVGRSAFLCCCNLDMEHNCCIRAILPYRD